MVSGGINYPEGPKHVLPLLQATLPAIDSNDVRKCVVAFQFISTFVTLVPIVDCSSAVETRTDLTPIEYDLCLATAQFESFVLQFMDRCFSLIENSAYEHRPERQDNESIRLNAEEGITEIGLSSTFSSILAQSSPQICDAILDRLYSFIANRIFETKVAGKLISSMVGKAARATPEKTCKKFIPHFSRLIIALTATEDMTNDDKLDEELLFSLQLLSEIVKCDGQVLLQYRSELEQVLEATLHLTSPKGYMMAHSLLSNVLKHLTTMYLLEFRCCQTEYGSEAEVSAGPLPVREWGVAGNINQLKPHFHLPSDLERDFARHLIETFVLKEVEQLEKWTMDTLSDQQKSREEIRKSLNLILEGLTGASAVLPIWTGDTVVLNDSPVPSCIWRAKEVGIKPIVFSDGRNIREIVVRSLRRISRRILENSEDIKSLNIIVRLYHMLMFNFGMTKSDFDTRWKSFHMVKKALENKLVGMKKHIRPLILDRIMLQHELRVRHKTLSPFTTLHEEIMQDLLVLSTSHYSEVRQKAQDSLNTCFGHHSYAYRLIIEPIIAILSKDSDSSHETFKGALYVLIGKRGRSILTVSDWKTISTLWLAVVNAKHSEKPSIIRLLANLRDKIVKYFETISITIEVPVTCESIAECAWKIGLKPQTAAPSEDDKKAAAETRRLKNAENLKKYHELVEGIVQLVDEHKLHWRYVDLAFSFLSVLMRQDVTFPISGVRLLVNGLVNDSLDIRKMCISSMGTILSVQKRPHVKKLIEPPDRNSNEWLQFKRTVDYSQKDVWQQTVFIFKPYIGFYCYPRQGIKVTDFKKEPRVNRTRDQLSPEEVPVFDFFSSQDSVDKLMKFLSLEEKKGSDKFNTRRFQMFKNLFMNFGPQFLHVFEPHLKLFVKSKHESQQRSASEIVAGLMRGSRHWPYEENMVLKNFMIPLLKDALNSITPETFGDWGTW